MIGARCRPRPQKGGILLAARGFGQLRESDASHIASSVAAFPRRSVGPYTRMMLICFANLYYGDKVPYFTMGYREVAKRSGCGEDSARRFLKSMEDDGTIVPIGYKNVYGIGRIPKRTFWWLIDGMRVKPTHGCCGIPEETNARAGRFERGNQRTTEAELQSGAVRATLARGAADAQPMTDEEFELFMESVDGGDRR